MGSGKSRRTLGVLIGFLLGAGTGMYACTLPLTVEIACGDGYVDFRAGEECDPLVEDSFSSACAEVGIPEGAALCDEETCEIVNTVEQCAVCGDGQIDGDEQCDGTNLDNEKCPLGDDVLRCNADCTFDDSLCNRCGDGTVDAELLEECDVASLDEIAEPRPCAGADIGGPGEIRPLTNPAGTPYTAGFSVACTDDCKYSRLSCSFCNNDFIDPARAIDLDGNLSLPEVCDGDKINLDHLEGEFPNSSCWEPDPEGNTIQRPNVTCDADCSGYVTVAGPGCCIQSGAQAPEDDEEPKCCYQYAHPGETPTELFIDGAGQQLLVCR